MPKYEPVTTQIQRAELLRALSPVMEQELLQKILMDLDMAELIAKKHYECPHTAIQASPDDPRCSDCGTKVPMVMYKAYMATFQGGQPDADTDV